MVKGWVKTPPAKWLRLIDLAGAPAVGRNHGHVGALAVDHPTRNLYGIRDLRFDIPKGNEMPSAARAISLLEHLGELGPKFETFALMKRGDQLAGAL